jgi:hypothetical protein
MLLLFSEIFEDVLTLGYFLGILSDFGLMDVSKCVQVGAVTEDHVLLLKCSRPLLQSRNSAVVLAVASMHFYLAPYAELPKVYQGPRPRGHYGSLGSTRRHTHDHQHA